MDAEQILADVSDASHQSQHEQHDQDSVEPENCLASCRTAGIGITFSLPGFQKHESSEVTGESSVRPGKASEAKEAVSEVALGHASLSSVEGVCAVSADDQSEEHCNYERERLEPFAVNEQVLLAKPKTIQHSVGKPFRKSQQKLEDLNDPSSCSIPLANRTIEKTPNWELSVRETKSDCIRSNKNGTPPDTQITALPGTGDGAEEPETWADSASEPTRDPTNPIDSTAGGAANASTEPSTDAGSGAERTRKRKGASSPVDKTQKKAKTLQLFSLTKRTPSAIIAGYTGDNWDERRSSGITIRRRKACKVSLSSICDFKSAPVAESGASGAIEKAFPGSSWAAYVTWLPSLRAQVAEPNRRHVLREQEWIAQAGAKAGKFNCFEEAYQGRKAYLEEHIGVAQTQQVLRMEEMRKDQFMKKNKTSTRTKQVKRKAACNTNRMEKRPKLAPIQGTSSLNGASRHRDQAASLRRARKSQASPRRRAVLPWGVVLDRRNPAHPFQTSIGWPKTMWGTVEGLGYVKSARGGEWRQSVGCFKSARAARDAIESFIHKLPCRELKEILFSYRTEAERRKGYAKGSCHYDSDADAGKTSWAGSRIMAGRMQGASAAEKIGARDSMASPRSSGSGNAVLPWGVGFNNNLRGTYTARISWPKKLWNTVKKLRYEFLPNERGNSWEHRIGCNFTGVKEARQAVENFINELPDPDLKTALFENRALGEKKKGYVSGYNGKGLMSKSQDPVENDLTVSSGIFPVLPWAVSRGTCDKTGTCKFWARVSWPKNLWPAVRHHGFDSHSKAVGREWKHHIGKFNTAHEARDAIDTFISDLPSDALKTALRTRRTKREQQSGYDSVMRPSAAAAAAAAGRKKARREEEGTREAASKFKIGDHVSGRFPNGGWYGAEIKQKIGNRWLVDWDDEDNRARMLTESELKEDAKKTERERKMSDDAVLPWSVTENDRDRRANDRDSRASRPRAGFIARMYWPKEHWDTVGRLGFEHRPPAGSKADWKHRVGGTFRTPREAREALETFIHGLACPELKLHFFTRRREVEMKSGYATSDPTLVSESKNNDAQPKSKLRRQRDTSSADSDTEQSPQKQKAEHTTKQGYTAGTESFKLNDSRPRVDRPLLPWGITARLSRGKEIVGFEANFRWPKELLRGRTSVRSGGKDFEARTEKLRLGCVDTVEEAISMQLDFIDGLEYQELAQELRRRRDEANNNAFAALDDEVESLACSATSASAGLHNHWNESFVLIKMQDHEAEFERILYVEKVDPRGGLIIRDFRRPADIRKEIERECAPHLLPEVLAGMDNAGLQDNEFIMRNPGKEDVITVDELEKVLVCRQVDLRFSEGGQPAEDCEHFCRFAISNLLWKPAPGNKDRKKWRQLQHWFLGKGSDWDKPIANMLKEFCDKHPGPAKARADLRTAATKAADCPASDVPVIGDACASASSCAGGAPSRRTSIADSEKQQLQGGRLPSESSRDCPLFVAVAQHCNHKGDPSLRSVDPGGPSDGAAGCSRLTGKPGRAPCPQCAGEDLIAAAAKEAASAAEVWNEDQAQSHHDSTPRVEALDSGQGEGQGESGSVELSPSAPASARNATGGTVMGEGPRPQQPPPQLETQKIWAFIAPRAGSDAQRSAWVSNSQVEALVTVSAEVEGLQVGDGINDLQGDRGDSCRLEGAEGLPLTRNALSHHDAARALTAAGMPVQVDAKDMPPAAARAGHRDSTSTTSLSSLGLGKRPRANLALNPGSQECQVCLVDVLLDSEGHDSDAPIFSCAEGHLLCGACAAREPSQNPCPTCASPDRFRNRALEGLRGHGRWPRRSSSTSPTAEGACTGGEPGGGSGPGGCRPTRGGGREDSEALGWGEPATGTSGASTAAAAPGPVLHCPAGDEAEMEEGGAVERREDRDASSAGQGLLRDGGAGCAAPAARSEAVSRTELLQVESKLAGSQPQPELNAAHIQPPLRSQSHHSNEPSPAPASCPPSTAASPSHPATAGLPAETEPGPADMDALRLRELLINAKLPDIKVQEALAWFKSEGLESIEDLKEAEMEQEFVEALQLLGGRGKIVLKRIMNYTAAGGEGAG